MKYALIGIALVALLWVGIVVIYGTQINVVYLCSRATEIQQKIPEYLTGASLQQHVAEELSSAVYAPELRRMIIALSAVEGSQARELFIQGLAEIMGTEYECKPMIDLLAPNHL